MPTIFIPIGNNKYAMIDAADWEIVRHYQWRTQITGYRVNGDAIEYVGATINGRLVYLHRLLMSPGKKIWVDHINGDHFDCRRENLRIATPTQNAANSRLSLRNSSGYKGVTWDRDRNKWRAQIYFAGKNIKLGRFNDPKDAAKAYDEAAMRIFGEFARTNEKMHKEKAA